MSAENNKQLTRREFLKVSVVAGAGAVLAACGMPEPEPTDSTVTPGNTAVPLTPRTGTEETQQPISTETLLQSTPTVELQRDSFGEGGEYPEGLKELETVVNQEQNLREWMEYWSKAGLFNPQSDEIKYKYFFQLDRDGNPKDEVIVALEAVKGDYRGNLIIQPVDDNATIGKSEGDLPLVLQKTPPLNEDATFSLEPNDPTRPIFLDQSRGLVYDFDRRTFISKGEDGNSLYVDAIGHWYELGSRYRIEESENLRYHNEGMQIPIYDLSIIKDVDGLDGVLRQKLYPEIVETDISEEENRRMEFFVSKKVYDSFIREGISFKGWVARHTNYLNGLAEENNLDLRVDINRVIVLSDEISTDMKTDWHFWQGCDEYELPTDTYNRWVIDEDCRESDYYNGQLDLDIGTIHEIGHYGYNLWDLYFLDFNPSETDKIRVNNLERDVVILDPKEQEYPQEWLMVGSKEPPVLSPFSVAAIEYFNEKGIDSWEKAWDYWTKTAFKDGLNDQLAVRITDEQGEPAEGMASIFIAEVNGIDEIYGWTMQRSYNQKADQTSQLNGGEVILPNEVKGYGLTVPSSDYDPLAFPDDIRAFGKNFLMIVVTKEGEIKQFPFTSYDLWLASRQAEGEEIAKLHFKVSD
ncbi:twin-arginine translocation signal domain-containing protein [Candidatus Woesebacteria bacterium]|nr:twin-arginine translocation signal domain-containing protein [Candidatus Woesebacteria bacterium]